MKLISIFTTFLALILSAQSKINAQSPDWLWAKSFIGSGIDNSSSIDIDSYGNICTIGSFSDLVHFDPGSGNHDLFSSGFSDIYISKSDSSGNIIWVKGIGDINYDIGFDIAIDASNNLYITGYFQGTVDFDPDSGNYYLTSSNPLDPDIFIAKYDSSCNLKWAAAIGGVFEDYGSSISVDAAANVYTTGLFSGTADFDPDSAGNFSMTAANSDVFISKLDSSGKFLWAKQFYGGYNENSSIAVDDSGNCYTTGSFEDTIDFDPGPGINNLISSGGYDIFNSKLDSSGNFKWAYSLGENNNAVGSSIVLDDSGNIYTAGYFNDTVDFNPGSGIFNLISNGSNDFFFSKLDQSGNFIWAKSIGGTHSEGGGVTIDKSGNVYTFGYFNDTVDFDPGPGLFNLISNSSTDIFISKLNSSGNLLWAKAAGGSDIDGISSIALDASGVIYATGFFRSLNITLGLTTLTNATVSGKSDIYIAKLDNTITGIDEVNNNIGISIYPNPASNYLTITLSENHKNADMIIKDISGKILYASIIKDSQRIDLSISDFSYGIYLLQIKSDDFIEMRKFVVVR